VEPATGPISVASSNPSPTVIFWHRATSRGRNDLAIGRCSRIRLVDVHHWPALEKPAVTAASNGIEIGIGHHDQRVLATELELRMGQMRGSLRLNLLPPLDR
jgi:hypothetical protein